MLLFCTVPALLLCSIQHLYERYAESKRLDFKVRDVHKISYWGCLRNGGLNLSESSFGVSIVTSSSILGRLLLEMFVHAFNSLILL